MKTAVGLSAERRFYRISLKTASGLYGQLVLNRVGPRGIGRFRTDGVFLIFRLTGPFKVTMPSRTMTFTLWA
jgi:hypothetical protein